MNEPIITVEKLSKCYRIGTREQNHRTLREAIVDGFKAPVRNFERLRKLTKFEANQTSVPEAGNHNGGSDMIWALQNVSFEVHEGEVLGIIGRNGAGKSTLLKILSRITEPTIGDVKLYGRVSSLLEVGTGFHPELTGRENIFLNGAILGMSKDEIREKFEEIVAFAEVEKFIDTPVKRYSSGMYVRLAFAVAAHLEPEILIVDEVLAVGDAQFQKKCLGKMEDVGKQGRTVLFVSHNMAAISKLCQRALLLNDGHCDAMGRVPDVIGVYLRDSEVARVSHVDLRKAPRWHDNRESIITSISLHRGDGSESVEFATGEDMIVRIGYVITRSLAAYCAIHFLNYLGDIVMSVRSTHTLEPFVISGRGHIECVLPDIRLLSGEYTIRLAVGRVMPVEDWLDGIPEAVRFRVNIGSYLGGIEWVNGPGHGAIAQKSRWRIHRD